MDEVSTYPRSRDEAFDFRTEEVLPWEKENIRKALAARKLQIRQNWHGGIQARKREILVADIYHCITYGKAKYPKDLPPWDPEEKGVRQPGINYDGPKKNGRGNIRVKVGWTPLGYTVVTAHLL